MPTITLQLGDVQFSETEIPENIKIGTEHRTSVHKLIGGHREVNMLGPDHAPIEWSGYFIGSNAYARARLLKQMCDTGLPLSLTWSQFNYQVVISHFEADFERDYQLPYSITCLVLQDLTAPLPSAKAPSPDAVLAADNKTVDDLALLINHPEISKAILNVTQTVDQISSIATAATGKISQAITYIHTAQQQVQTVIASTEKTLSNISTLGGILPNNPVARSVSRLSAQVNAITSQLNLVKLNGVLGRMTKTLGQVNQRVKIIQSGADNLYSIASKAYGTVSGWTEILKANPQLKGDPQVPNNTTLAIPPFNGDAGDANSEDLIYA